MYHRAKGEGIKARPGKASAGVASVGWINVERASKTPGYITFYSVAFANTVGEVDSILFSLNFIKDEAGLQSAC